MKAKPTLHPIWTGTDWVYAPFTSSSTLEEAQASLTSITNAQAYTYLQPTDWLAARKAETGEEIPPEWSDWRQSIRDNARTKVQQISEKTSLDSLREYTMSDAYLVWPDEP